MQQLPITAVAMLRRLPLVYDAAPLRYLRPSPSSRKASHRDVRRESVSSCTEIATTFVTAMAAILDMAAILRAFLRFNVHVALQLSHSAHSSAESRDERPPYGTDDQIAPGRYPRYLPVHVSSVEEYLRNTYVIRGQATTDTHVGTLIKTHFPTAQR